MERTTLGVLAFLALCAVGANVLAQDTRNAELASYDARLNETYRAIMGQLDEQRKDKLRQAQRAWITMRDFDCQWASVDSRDCLIDRTINREQELRESYFTDKDGQYRSIGR